MYEGKKQELYDRERKRWERMDYEYLKNENKMMMNKEKNLVGRKNNPGMAFNPLTLQYDNSVQGEILRQRDEESKYRALMRATNIDQHSNAGYNILTGEDRTIMQHRMKNEIDPKIYQKNINEINEINNRQNNNNNFYTRDPKAYQRNYFEPINEEDQMRQQYMQQYQQQQQEMNDPKYQVNNMPLNNQPNFNQPPQQFNQQGQLNNNDQPPQQYQQPQPGYNEQPPQQYYNEQPPQQYQQGQPPQQFQQGQPQNNYDNVNPPYQQILPQQGYNEQPQYNNDPRFQQIPQKTPSSQNGQQQEFYNEQPRQRHNPNDAYNPQPNNQQPPQIDRTRHNPNDAYNPNGGYGGQTPQQYNNYNNNRNRHNPNDIYNPNAGYNQPPQYVAIYKDRPNDVREAYKIAIRLAMYYNA